MTKVIRTRFAPSPSGFLHVGGARTALFNYLYAKARGGQYILRVEDTDQERSTPESERIILDSLKWLGIIPDEGPDEGGDFGPYRQSERLNIYSKYTDMLLEKNLAYPCFCTEAELEQMHEAAKRLGVPNIYDGRYANLPREEAQARIKKGEKYSIRLRVSGEEVVVQDLVQGKIKFDSRLIGDFIIVKSDGFPTYNYAVVIDDFEMKISHVIRGVGHLSNTPRQILIHNALSLPVPEYSHISEIVGTDKKKLSKRRGATSVLFFRDMGYLPEAFNNYMALLGWYPEDAAEFMPMAELKRKFDVARCSKSPSMFDFFLNENNPEPEDFKPEDMNEAELKKMVNKKTKLNWLNNKYIRTVSMQDLWPEAARFLEKDKGLSAMIKKDQKRMIEIYDRVRMYLDTLEDAVPFFRELLKDRVEVESKEAADLIKPEEAKNVIAAFAELVRAEKPSTPEQFADIMKQAGVKTGAKGKGLFMPIRIASTGSMHGLELPNLFAILGPEQVLARIAQLGAG
ncbi:MAG: glutamate--tRNA ligase [Leptospirales bacterium]|nr:glutamate--tRNA ligase [Leptospirales bacterium]